MPDGAAARPGWCSRGLERWRNARQEDQSFASSQVLEYKKRRQPLHMLVTAPESLYIMLTPKKSRALFTHVETIIIDDVVRVGDQCVHQRWRHAALESPARTPVPPPNKPWPTSAYAKRTVPLRRGFNPILVEYRHRGLLRHVGDRRRCDHNRSTKGRLHGETDVRRSR